MVITTEPSAQSLQAYGTFQVNQALTASELLGDDVGGARKPPRFSIYFFEKDITVPREAYLKDQFVQEIVNMAAILRLEDRLARDPERLMREVAALPESITTVVIDEVQKIPALLNVVHSMIESSDARLRRRFVLTGSSARKLRAESANLLAGRALAYSLFPFTSFELGNSFELNHAQKYGTLPKVAALKTDASRWHLCLW